MSRGHPKRLYRAISWWVDRTKIIKNIVARPTLKLIKLIATLSSLCRETFY